jgi:hypothetical protein
MNSNGVGFNRVRVLMTLEYVALFVLAVLWILEWIFGTSKIVFTFDGFAPASGIVAYAPYTNWYPYMRWGGGDWVVLTFGMYSIFTFGFPIGLAWLCHDVNAIYYAGGSILIFFGFIPELIRFIMMTVSLFTPTQIWYTTIVDYQLENISRDGLASSIPWISRPQGFCRWIQEDR